MESGEEANDVDLMAEIERRNKEVQIQLSKRADKFVSKETGSKIGSKAGSMKDLFKDLKSAKAGGVGGGVGAGIGEGIVSIKGGCSLSILQTSQMHSRVDLENSDSDQCSAASPPQSPLSSIELDDKDEE